MAYIHHIAAYARRRIQFSRTCIFRWRPWFSGPASLSLPFWVGTEGQTQFRWKVHSEAGVSVARCMHNARWSTPACWVAAPQCQPTNSNSRSISAPSVPQLLVQSSSQSLTINRTPGMAPARHQAPSSARLKGAGQLTSVNLAHFANFNWAKFTEAIPTISRVQLVIGIKSMQHQQYAGHLQFCTWSRLNLRDSPQFKTPAPHDSLSAWMQTCGNPVVTPCWPLIQMCYILELLKTSVIINH